MGSPRESVAVIQFGNTMRILAISREHSSHDAIALVTKPALTSEVFLEAQERATANPEFSSISLESLAGCLVVCSDQFTETLRVQLESLLSEAEDEVSGAAEQRRLEVEQREREAIAEQEKREKELNLESASTGFGLPID
jgi:hypothetical protein